MSQQFKCRGTPPRWVAEKLLPDPGKLPVRFKLARTGQIASVLGICDHIVIGPHAIAVQTRIRGVKLRVVKLPFAAFTGIALQIRVNNAASECGGPKICYALHLVHDEARYCLPVFRAFDDLDVGAQWQAWAKTCLLPLLIETPAGGYVEPEQRLGLLRIGSPVSRCARTLLFDRRPHRSIYRHAGTPYIAERYMGREIIARS